MLDMGCGSGILAIAAARLGYEPVAAFDYDLEAVRIARENVKMNKLSGVVHPRRADLTRLPFPKKQYDVVCANLMADLLIAEAKKIRAFVKPGGHLILAGILRREFPIVTKSFQRNGLTLQASRAHKEWQSGHFVLMAKN